MDGPFSEPHGKDKRWHNVTTSTSTTIIQNKVKSSNGTTVGLSTACMADNRGQYTEFRCTVQMDRKGLQINPDFLISINLHSSAGSGTKCLQTGISLGPEFSFNIKDTFMNIQLLNPFLYFMIL